MNEAIVFENVDFAYDEGEKNVVEDLSFKVERGSFVALVGRKVGVVVNDMLEFVHDHAVRNKREGREQV